MLRILIVAADPYVRSGLAAMLEDEEAFEVCGQIEPVEFLRGQIGIYTPDLILLDGQDALVSEGALVTTLSASEWPILILVSEEKSLRQGWPPVASILQRSVAVHKLHAALHAVGAGLLVIDPGLDMPNPAQAALVDKDAYDQLTGRELEVLHKVADGLTNKAIAQSLGISENTVKFHVNSLFQKLNVQSRTEAVVRAVQAGLLPL